MSLVCQDKSTLGERLPKTEEKLQEPTMTTGSLQVSIAEQKVRDDEPMVAEASQPLESAPEPKLEPIPDTEWPAEVEPAITTQSQAVERGEEEKAVEEKRAEEGVAGEAVAEGNVAEEKRVVEEKAEEPCVEAGLPRSPPTPQDTRSVKVEDGEQLGEVEEEASKAVEEQVREYTQV